LAKDKDGKPHPYGVEMAGAAAVAEQGITAETMKAGTIVSVKVNPLRDGTDFWLQGRQQRDCQMSLEDAPRTRQGPVTR